MKIKNNNERGISIIAMAFMIMILGGFLVVALQLYNVSNKYEKSARTDKNLEEIRSAMALYFSQHGRYPCPGSLVAGIDEDGFGKEVLSDCTASDVPGTFRAAGRGGRMVRTGSVPVRTLGLPDSLLFDGYKQRFVYVVTEAYAVEGSVVSGEEGAIYIIDKNGNSSTSAEGNIVQMVMSMGDDRNGAYSVSGVLEEACDVTKVAGENCNFDNDAIFINTAAKSEGSGDHFVHRMLYDTGRRVLPCEEAVSTPPKNSAFLVDTSGSMASGGDCPSTLPGCSRMDVARWSMRRVIPSVVHNNGGSSEPGQTSITGFVGYDSVNNVRGNLVNIVFDDPTADGYAPPEDEDLMEDLEAELQSMCPWGSTPLGIHLQALADKLGDGTEDRPNKITVISDGLSNNGTNPVSVAHYIAATYPNLEVDIIDVVGNSSLMQIASITGGKYYASSNPDELLDALYSSAGVCEPYTPIEPVDTRGCGSTGSW